MGIIRAIESRLKTVFIIWAAVTFIVVQLVFVLPFTAGRILIIADFLFLSLCVFCLIHRYAADKADKVLFILSGLFAYFGICALSVFLLCLESAVDELSKEGLREVMRVLLESRVIHTAVLTGCLFLAAVVFFL